MACYTAVCGEGESGVRVDRAIARLLPALNSRVVRDAFSRRDVKLDGRRVRPDARVVPGQTIQVYCMPQEDHPIEVVYEDGDVLLVSKRAGLSVEPDSGGGVSLAELAADHVRRSDPGAPAPIPCHRLDNQTCGLLLFAKHDAAAEILRDVFRRRSLDKRYTCLVKGQPKPPSATCRAWLRRLPEEARVEVLDHPAPGALPILTAYETLEGGPVSRLRVHLITGRTHQIRAHMAALGHPLLGDDVYGDRALNRAQRAQGRLMLCATELTLDTQGRLPQLDGRLFTIPCPF